MCIKATEVQAQFDSIMYAWLNISSINIIPSIIFLSFRYGLRYAYIIASVSHCTSLLPPSKINNGDGDVATIATCRTPNQRSS